MAHDKDRRIARRQLSKAAREAFRAYRDAVLSGASRADLFTLAHAYDACERAIENHDYPLGYVDVLETNETGEWSHA